MAGQDTAGKAGCALNFFDVYDSEARRILQELPLDGGGLGNWHDMNLCCVQYGTPSSGKTCIGNAAFKSFRTTSEAQAGWGACWNANQGGTFGSDSFLPPANRCSDSCASANWASSSGVDYDYAIFLR